MTPVGTYYGPLVKAETTQAGTGNPQIVVTFNVKLAWHDNEWHPVDIGERRLFMSLTDKARSYTADKLKTLGFNGQFGLPRFSNEAMNEGVQLQCRHEMYAGTNRERWELADWNSGSQLLAADPLRSLDAWWESLRSQAAKPVGQPSAPAAKPATRTDPPMTPGEVDDNIPFDGATP